MKNSKIPTIVLGTCLCCLSVVSLVSATEPGDAELLQLSHVAAPPAAEDMVALPDSRWVISSAVSIGAEANPGLYALSNTPPHLEKLSFTAARPPEHSQCPEVLAPEDFSPLGIDLLPQGDKYQLLAINRGRRAAVERFSLSLKEGHLQLAWQDCLPLPEQISANSVAATASGDLYLTNAFDPRDPKAWEKRVRGEPTGQLQQWSAEEGWIPADVNNLPSPNGLAVSPDGCFAIVAAWSTRQLVRQELPCPTASQAPDKYLELPFMPDNLRWTSRGTVLATGQDTTPDQLLGCVHGKATCPNQVTVVEVEPDAMRILHQWHLDAGTSLGLGTTALEVGDDIWVSSILGRVIGKFQPEER